MRVWRCERFIPSRNDSGAVGRLRDAIASRWGRLQRRYHGSIGRLILEHCLWLWGILQVREAATLCTLVKVWGGEGVRREITKLLDYEWDVRNVCKWMRKAEKHEGKGVEGRIKKQRCLFAVSNEMSVVMGTWSSCVNGLRRAGRPPILPSLLMRSRREAFCLLADSSFLRRSEVRSRSSSRVRSRETTWSTRLSLPSPPPTPPLAIPRRVEFSDCNSGSA